MFGKTGSVSGRQQTAGGSDPRKLRKKRSFSEMASLSPTNASTFSTTRPTGRGHSQSVTEAYFVPRTAPSDPIPRVGDMFADVMGWLPPSTLSASLSGLSKSSQPADASSSRSHKIIPRPFGSTVLFQPPSTKPLVEFLPSPRLLREMQPFESGLTAKQTDLEQSRSVFRLRDPTSVASFLTTESDAADSDPASIPFSPKPETELHSRYSTDVFDVLQTYRGLPLLEELSSGEETTVKMSLSSDNTAAPKDDPRFVIWGELVPDRDPDERSIKSGKAKAAMEMPSLKPSSEDGAQKILVAATIERWIAQLTSDLSYDELLNFFLTYRTYFSAVDLCHLLICRFHWALQQPSSTQDEMVRRVVRARTFVAIRYWLLTFFTVDFMPDRELRLLIAHWLNTLIRDPILTKHIDGLSIVRKLKKVTKDCKKIHTRAPSEPKQPRPTSIKTPSDNQGHAVLGEHFAAATRKAADEEEDSDVDLDFLTDEQALPEAPSEFNGDDLANAHLSTVHLGSSTRASTMPLSSLSILQRTGHLASESNSDAPFVQSPATLSIHHSALSRVFVKTIGRLGRWKRVLNQRSGVRTPIGAYADIDAIDPELTVGRDLLTVNGGVEQYLKMIGQVSSVAPAATASPAAAVPAAVPVSSPQAVLPAVPAEPSPTPPMVTTVSTPCPVEAPPEYVDSVITASEAEQPAIPPAEDAASIVSESLEVSSPDRPDSIDRPSSFRAQSQWQFEVMSIDDLDLSDNSSNEHADGPSVPPGLSQPVRQLPLRREFEFVRRSDSVSSMSMQSAGHSSAMNALVDSLSDDEEDGDVQAALHQLEGQINPPKQQEKASKVDGWMRTMRVRFLNGDYDDQEVRQFSDEEEEDFEERSSFDDPAADADANDPRDITIVELGGAAAEEHPSVDTPTSVHQSPPRPADDSKPAPEDAVLLEIFQSRMPAGAASPPHPATRPPVSKFVTGDLLRFHRSYILSHRAQVLAGHFAMIDRELFMGVKFEEFLDDWMTYEDVEVLDWVQFLKDRARSKSDPEWADKISALAAVRARFNLMTNFVVSEIASSPPNERHAVVAKFIRIAWHSYLLSSFNTLVAIISGLRNPWVTQAIKTWKGVGRWEVQVFNDLKVYVTSTDDFKYIRRAIADTNSQDVGSHASVVSGGDNDPRASKHKSMNTHQQSSACVPFIGVYLSQLYRHNQLPDLIDPTAPTEAVGIDSITSNFDAPSHPEVFSALAPLPPSMHLEPLINVHKQRMIAGVIKSMVAGQHLASRFQFQTEKRLYQKCLRMRGLDPKSLQALLTLAPSPRVRVLDPESL
ncbi:ras guanine nucleotide exchange factor domain-containing protein [Mycena capillaripes]|nr:ras guanine nucleotide exchange factor domain-containing protein [Mycena capillaripes]